MERGLVQVGQQQDNVLSTVNSLHAKLDGILNAAASHPHVSETHQARYASIAGRADNQNIPRRVQAVTRIGANAQDTGLSGTLQPVPGPGPPPAGISATSSTSEKATTATSGRPLCVSLDGQDFYFQAADLPSNPPSIHYSDDIPGLFRDWHSSGLLVVSGHGIPIKHWDKFYKKRGYGGVVTTDVWETIKAEWGNWKVRTNITE